MAGEEDSPVSIRDLAYWLVLLGVILAALGAYFWLAPRTRAMIHPAGVEGPR